MSDPTSGGIHIRTYAVPLDDDGAPGHVQFAVVVTPLPGRFAQGLSEHLKLATNNYLADRKIVSGQMSDRPLGGFQPKPPPKEGEPG